MNTKTTTCKNCAHPACFHCQHPVRSSAARLADHPGTVVGILSESVCQSCKRRGGPPTEGQQPATDNCVGCGTRFRPYGTTIADYPGTVLNHSGGHCSTCKRRADRAAMYEAQREQKRFHLSDAELARIRRVAPEAYAYHMARRPYREALGQKIGATA